MKTLTKSNVCSVCGKGYESNIVFVSAGHPLDLSGGKCPDCRTELAKQQELEGKITNDRILSNTRETWRKTCGIPLRFSQSRFSNFNRKVDRTILKTLDKCIELTEKYDFTNPRNTKSIIMYSNLSWGVGKTHLSCSIAHAILDKWQNETKVCPVMFISEPELFLRIRNTFNRQNGYEQHETEESIYKKLTTVPLLILDDVGKEETADTRFVQRVLFAVVNGRYQNMLPIVITANLNPELLADHFGGEYNCATMDRIIEMSGSKFWELKGESYRDATKRLST